MFAWVGCEFADYRAVTAFLRRLSIPKDSIVAFSHGRRSLSDEEALEQSARE
ncbi:hypothetical protein BIWAKO_05764 [Bosea sp. BIWAKO-01]|nr:hypothetical protein BIWAKO_05764 [Bosea sp. BIWAKO-01]